MKELTIKLMELEEIRNGIEKVQKTIKEQLPTLDDEEYLQKEMVYASNKSELQNVNKQIQIINSALEILSGLEV